MKHLEHNLQVADIVKRLRAPVTVERHDGLLIEAADEIERLREQNKQLKAAIALHQARKGAR